MKMFRMCNLWKNEEAINNSRLWVTMWRWTRLGIGDMAQCVGILANKRNVWLLWNDSRVIGINAALEKDCHLGNAQKENPSKRKFWKVWNDVEVIINTAALEGGCSLGNNSGYKKPLLQQISLETLG